MIGDFKSRQFVVFLLTGGIAALINFGSRIIYNNWLSFSTSVILAYITGMITAFVLARLFVFKDSSKPAHHSAFIFMLVNVFAVLQTWAISMGLALYALPYAGVRSYTNEIAHAVGVLVPVFTSYLGHKHWSFK
jgi:putative flippase GtrA